MVTFFASLLAFITPAFNSISNYQSFVVPFVKVEEAKTISVQYNVKELDFDKYNNDVNYFNHFPNSSLIPDNQKQEGKSFLIKVWIWNLTNPSSQSTSNTSSNQQ